MSEEYKKQSSGKIKDDSSTNKNNEFNQLKPTEHIKKKWVHSDREKNTIHWISLKITRAPTLYSENYQSSPRSRIKHFSLPSL